MWRMQNGAACVLSDAGGWWSADQETLIRSAISSWRVSLIDFTSANRLLDLKPGAPGMIEVSRPAAGEILARLTTDGCFAFRSLKPWAGADTVPPPAPYLLDTAQDADDLDAALGVLMRRSNQEFQERGRPALYLTFGTLTWADQDQVRYTSPLLLVPVRLVPSEPRQAPMLEPTEHDPVVNPALGLKLSRHRIVLPRVDDLAGVTLSALLDAVRAAVAAQDGWLVSESVALSSFSLMNEPVYRDLLDNEDLVAAHPAVRALAVPGPAGTGRAAETGGREAGAGPPAALPPLILDADSAQRSCITTALAGRSFTIDGPPGTGKSQTIANMIGALLHAGKTVLAVSEKAAALDVVRDRLAGAGLGRYLLELHSHQAARKEVAASLASALDAAAQAHAAPPMDADLPGSRDQLSSYAHAVNRVRDPLGYSLHDVLAMIGSLHAVPAAPVTGLAPVRLTPEVLAEVRRAAAALAATWRPAAQGRSFAWRGVIERGSLEDQLYQAASALEALGRVVRANQLLADATRLTRPSDAHALARLLDHLLTWPESMPDEWLTVDTLDVVDAAVAQLAAGLTAIAAREAQASQAAGVPWRTVPPHDQLPAADAADTAALAALRPRCADVGALAAGQIVRVAQELSAAADLLEKSLGTMSELARILGVHSPVTFNNANDLLTLARLAAEPERPERAWLSVPSQRAASDAAQVLYDAHRALATAEADARAYFTADALRHDAGGLAQRFASEYHGLGRLSAAYRADKKTVEAFTREGVAEETAQEHLGLAAAWKHAVEALAAAEARYAALLGPHYAGQATDFTRLDQALSHAATAVRCARGQDLSRAAGYISRDAALNGTIAGLVAEARRDLLAWQAALAPAIGPRPELLNGTITEAIGWLRAHLKPLHAAAAFTQAVGEAVGRSLTFGQARQLVALRRAADSARAQLIARDSIFRDLCGQLYDGATTDVVALQEALEWARRLRTMISGGPGPLTPAHLAAAESAVPTDRLAKAADAWQEACGTLLAAFSPHRRQELAAELDDYQTGDDLLESMFNDVSGQGEWHAYQAAHAFLAAHGMGAAIDFCVTTRIEPARVPQVIERALLQEWADCQLRADPALAPLQSMGPGALVDGYRRLDRALAAAAADDIIRACTARPPPADAGESAVIRQEAAKKSAHMPVRELLGRAGRLTQAVKPCFLMSPPAVSLYLPPGMHFDVVIFDEASQISPAEAINCIYRGSAVILAGDDKQLTPASSARGVPDDGKERPPGLAEPAAPDSVFGLAKTAGPFGNRTLRWHYRSRHESLIGYSNAAFYDGRLVVVPGGGPETGVELFYGVGTYRRETSRDNPEEAARVAQRVIHHYDSRPALSLGVVTFSESQAGAIETALAKAREQRPDLDRYFTDDRLRGFFIKNAESVQGDERDVLILSVGYGPDENGQVSMDFGTLSRQGGWRRLNVATTRARYRTEIVSSIRGSDIPESVTSEGLLHLRRYLSYCGGHSPATRDR
jgi:uncharacterized protein DUF4011/AAA domain-containing protein